MNALFFYWVPSNLFINKVLSFSTFRLQLYKGVVEVISIVLI